jgi:Flp pilus assembly protein TadD
MELQRAAMRPVILSLVFSIGVLANDPVELSRARELYQRTDYDGALKLLSAGSNPSAAAHDLMGKSYFMKGEFKKASEAFEKAVATDPKNSSFHHWLGKAYGRRAETSSFLTAPGYASKTRRSFEQAVELDPRNLEAINDLFTYYLEAPGFLGGGFEKAQALAQKIREINPVEYHYAQAQLAQKREDFAATEEQLRRAAEMAPKQIGRVIDLAKFLAKQGKVEESEAAFNRAAQISPDDPKLLFERAATYIRAKRNLKEARELLQKYLEGPLTPENPSRAEAQKLLKQAGG